MKLGWFCALLGAYG